MQIREAAGGKMIQRRFSKLITGITLILLLVRCTQDPKLSLPIISITGVNSVSETTALIGAEIIDNGGGLIVSCGVCCDSLPEVSIMSSITVDSLTTNRFNSFIKGLKRNKMYYLRAYATNSFGTAYSEEISFKTTDRISDIDGNEYRTVRIGNQLWLSDNLRTTKFNDGSAIQNVTKHSQWITLNTAGYCWYLNNLDFKNPFGGIYNWHAVNSGKLAPTGWHVPTSKEWNELFHFLASHDYGYQGDTLKIAKALADSTYFDMLPPFWYSLDGSPENKPSKNNKSGFSGISNAIRNQSDDFISMGRYCFWWSATSIDSQNAISKGFMRDSVRVYDFHSPIIDGLSVRCVKDN